MRWSILFRVLAVEVLVLLVCLLLALIIYPGLPVMASLATASVMYVLSSIITFTLDFLIWVIKKKVRYNV